MKAQFAARLDDPLTDEVVVAEDGTGGVASGDGPVVIYDVRARVYRPTLGRFMQQDPLGTGVVVRESLRWGGERAWVQAAGGFDGGRAYQDGQHRMAFARGNGVGRGDATGLFGLLPIGPTTVMDLWSSHAENTLEAGSSVSGYVMEMFGEYSLNQLLDAEWAMDWSQPDDGYSRSANYAMGTGSFAESLDEAPDPQETVQYSMAGIDWVDPDAAGKVMNRLSPRNALKGIGIYVVLHPDTKDVLYVGRSSDMAARTAVQAARFAKLGISPVIMGIKTGNRSAARGLEQLLMATYKHVGEAGYNLTNGVSGSSSKAKTAKGYYNAMRHFVSRIR
ncbi:MAG: hypothetical protein Q8L55_15910 [Phycisphaerales bacterium]|nr:hypothetical protein [Phycisphaerales bacterium]